MAIGQTVWIFDQNRRIYRQDESGRSIGGPIFREHFRPVQVVGETPRSWVLSNGLKVAKNGGDIQQCGPSTNWGKTKVFLTAQAVDDECWRQDHRHHITRAVSNCMDADLLRQIAALVGYKETP